MENKEIFQKGIEPIFTTLAALDETKKTRTAKIPLPSKQCVEEAKQWVDENQK